MTLRWIGRGLLLLIIVLIGFAGWLLTTQRGLNLLVNVSQKMVPGLTISSAQGRLVDNIQLDKINYQPDADTHYQVNRLQLAWQPQKLLHGQLLIKHLHIDGVTLQTPPSQPASKPTKIKLPELAVPLQVVVEDFRLTDLQQRNKQQSSQTLLESLHLQAQLKHQQLEIATLNLKRSDADFAMQGEVTLSADYPVKLDYSYKLYLADINKIKAVGNIKGDMQKLMVSQQLSAPFKSSQTIQLTQLLHDLHWQATIKADQIDLASIQPQSTQTGQLQQLTVNASGSLNAIKAQLSGQFLQQNLPPVMAHINSSSDNLDDWQVSALFKLPKQPQLSLDGKITGVRQEPHIDVKGHWQQLRWPLSGDNEQVASPDGEFQLSGSLNKYQLNLAAQLVAAQQKTQIKADAVGTPQKITLSNLHLDALSGAADINGVVDLSTPEPNLKLTAEWQNMELPKRWSSMPVSSKTGHLTVTGSAQQFNLQSKLALDVNGEAVNVTTNGAGSRSGFNALQLNIATAKAGSLGFNGQLSWQPDLLLTGKIQADKLNPGFVSADWPGQLSGQGQVKFVQSSTQQMTLQLSGLAVNGKLRQRPLQLSVNQLHYQPPLINLDKLQLHSAQSVLTADGSLSDKWQLNWQLNSPDLSDFYPQLTGKIKAKGELLGNAKQPQLTATMSGQDLGFADKVKVASFTSDVQLGLAKNARINTRLNMQQLSFSGQQVDALQLKLDGTEQQHKLDFTAKAPELSVQGVLNGQWQAANSVWQGQFSKLNLTSKQAGNWQLQQAGQLILSAKHSQVDQQCLASDKGSLCFSAKQQQQNWQAQGKIAQLPLALFSFLTPEINQLKGNVNGEFNLEGQADKQLTGQGNLQLQQAELHLDNAAITQTKSIKFKQFALNYQLTPQQTQLQINIEPEVKGVSALQGQLQTAAVKTLINTPEQASLNGQLHLSVADLAELQLNHPQIESLHGGLKLNASIAGSVAKPAVDLTADLKQGQMTLPSAGIVLKSVTAAVNGNLEQGIQFTYQAKSGDGQVTGDGSVTTLAKSWQLKTHISGKNFQLMNLPEALVIASPDIQVEMTPDKSQVSGQLTIPEAALEPLQFNMPVSPSNDVVIVTKQPQQAKKATPILMNLKVKLGDKVKIKAMGFQGSLAGDLLISGDASNLLLGTGDITINNGTYLAYGQLLKVDNGKIHFSGGALDNPDLDIKAVRTGTDYSVGVHIEGPANQPQASLFSDPAMSQDDILSYLLLGHPIKQASAADAALLASAATGMGIQNGAMLGDQIASTFGLDEFTVSGDSKENAALQIGKYLSPKLYLSYGVGVFQPVTTVQLRYQLSKIWALKAESGTESGVDLMYNYER